MTPKFASPNSKSIPLDFIEADKLNAYIKSLSKTDAAWLKNCGFNASLGETALIADANGRVKTVVCGWGTESIRKRGRFFAATIAQQLPKGTYEIRKGLGKREAEEACLAWLLASYQFSRYKNKPTLLAKLKAPKTVDRAKLLAQAEGEFLTRDLINIPTNDLGPERLEKEFKTLAKIHSAQVKTIKGANLLKQNFPMIHAVGRASDQEPRLLDLRWGNPKHPKVTLVGKGVCFDTGGLNIKPASSMGLMKKDMGGAATVMGLAHMIMSLNLKVRLRVLIPAVENSISAGAYRPQDVLISRKGLSVEINNTDAEGRLVLADALSLADEEKPELLICNATLTGAARVALGPDVPPFYTDDEALAKEISKASSRQYDPLWRMPFWEGYEQMIEPDVADLDNAPKGGFGGSITAALFLRRFVENSQGFVHLDLYGWQPSPAPGRTKGGICQSARAILDVIEARYG